MIKFKDLLKETTVYPEEINKLSDNHAKTYIKNLYDDATALTDPDRRKVKQLQAINVAINAAKKATLKKK